MNRKEARGGVCPNCGAVDHFGARFEDKFVRCPMSGCWLWTAHTNGGGYGTFKIAGRQVLAHRVSWTHYVGPIQDDLRVLHRCDVRSCVNPAHLFLGTLSDNMRDMVAKGRQVLGAVGEQQWKARLTAAQVLAIRADTRPGPAIAREYGVCTSTVFRVRRRNGWRHLPEAA